jgi:YidC/Oxa1 family membrane protein insertase
MNIKEWIVPICLALITTWFVQRFVVDRFLRPAPTSTDQVSGFIAPQSEQLFRPLHVEIDFIDAEKKRPEIRTDVVTSWGVAQFSSHGAIVRTLDFNHAVDHHSETIRTVYPRANDDRQTHCFLLALNEPTPYFYELTEHEDTEDYALLTYKAAFAHGTVAKTFKVHKAIHKIDLNCEIVHAGDGAPVEARVVFPSPFMADIADREAISAICIDNKKSFERITWQKLNVNQGWFAPQMFGADDTYFMHMLCADPHAFVQRAYYKCVDKNMLISVLEGPAVTASASWNLSFYCGPKSDVEVNAVDSRLEQALGYAGWFAPLSKLFLKILIFLFDYVGNYGFAIILLTLILKLLMFPATMRSDARIKEQQQLAKEMQYLKQRYPNDPQRLTLEQAALVKKHGLPGMGCLPTLLQIPILISMRTLLTHTIQLYHAPFLWIPDLSVRDPYYILPLFLVFSMFGQAASVADKQQRMMLVGVGIVLGAIMAPLSAGLVLYFVIYGFLTMAQTQFVRYFNLA